MQQFATIWGWSKDKTTIAPGIEFFTTSSHGGYVLSPERNEEIPDYMRNNSHCYEEDCEWSKVVITFKQYFSEEQYQKAVKTLKDWFPEEYEIFFGETIKPGESYIKDMREFAESNSDNFIGFSAFGSWHKTVPKGFVGVYLRRESDRKEITKLVPKQEYDERWEKFVIQSNKVDNYEDWEV